ncbi:sperm acrosome membrane-associated protein 4-like [Dromiciops gliroides]|uniref:sperm acrosome membrane-associated protein 4-like n=1 Tax=Dromiciops gliroides TaxID=33562 RepID=UPI001CC50FC8|nr:sperm acrosome membrane-associated protein 4-like [Dromiciops gliroides]XP_043829769.1 sperm acrosome membrane-associated protein 4-like [Dromiciops gliroides]
MCPCTSIYLSLVFTFILAPVATAKECYYCDVTVAPHCVGTPMTCGEEEDCFVGRGTAQGFPGIIIKGCIQTISCGWSQSITHLDVTYNLTTYCCPGNLCNVIQPRRAPKPPDAATVAAVVAGLILALLLCWLL